MKICRWWLNKCDRRHHASRLQWKIGPIYIKNLRGVNFDMALMLTDEQKVSLAIQPVTAAGNPAKIDGVPAWNVSDPTVLSLDVAADGMSAIVTTTGTLGPCQVNCSADADLGDGVRTISALLDIEVVAAEAASMGIVAGTPELK